MKHLLVNWRNRVATSLQANPLNALAMYTRTPLASVAPVAAQVDATAWIDLSTVPMERALAEYIARDPFPLPAAANREGYYGAYHYAYWLSGLKDYLQIKQVLAKHGVPFSQLRTMLELGCATGRVLRHFVCQEPQLTVWGADINVNNIEWLLQHLGPAPLVFQNTLLPHLPLEDNSVDLFCAFSVFTHIDELELAWLAEVRRILRPGGIAYITLHTDHTWRILNKEHALFNALYKLRPYFTNYKISADLFAQPMPAPRIVFKADINGGRSVNLFQSKAYLQTVWSRFFKILEVIPEGSDYQDVIVLRKERH